MKDTKVLKENEAEKESTVPGYVQERAGQEADQKNQDISETWAEETIADLDDFIESQGIYIRQ